MKYSGLNMESNYIISEDNYLLENEGKIASLFATGNGYMGVRGSLEEYGSLCIQGAYIRGVIDEINVFPQPLLDNEYMKKHYFHEQELRRFQNIETIINFADFLLIRISIGGETFFPWEGKILDWKRYLDIKNCVLVRKVRWQNSKGQITTFNFERFASFDNDHTYAIKVEIVPENYDDTIEILTGVDSLTKTHGQLVPKKISAKTEHNTTYYANKSGERYGFEIATVTKNEIYKNGISIICDWQDASDEELNAIKTSFDAKKNTTYTLEKLVYVISSRESESPMKDATAAMLKTDRYDSLFSAHTTIWQKYFNNMDIVISGDDTVDTALRFNNYHTAISFNRNDSVHSLGAKGLTGEVYNNWVWWDCEAYQAPVFNYSQPEYAKNILLYRYNKLDAARENAKLEGRRGARFPFNSSVTGEEVVWKYVQHPFLQIHIVSDVGLAIFNYHEATGDDDFMIEYGMEMLLEICRYWADRVTFTNNRYEILNVTGTDEHHPSVDNNAYTNYSVHSVISKTLKYIEKYSNEISEVKSEIGLTIDEISKWKKICDNLYLPIDHKSGIIPQFDGYLQLSRDLEIANGSAATSYQMKESGMYHKSQVIKQPDVLMLFGHLNMKFNPEIYARNWNYYLARCEASSSLSFSTHAICSADLSMTESCYDYLMKTVMIDLLDEHNCTVQGIHSACAAGAWMSAVRGIGGVELTANGVVMHPHMIGWWQSMQFSFCWHSQRIIVYLTNECIELTSVENNTESVPISIFGNDYMLEKGKKIKHSLSIV